MKGTDDKSILIVIDLQNGFIREETRSLLDTIIALIDSKRFDAVLATQFVNFPGSMYERCLGYTKLEKEYDYALVPQLAAKVDSVYVKYGYNAISPNFLSELCRLNGGHLPETVYLAGISTEACVFSTAIGLFDSGIVPVVLADYSASLAGPAVHQTAIETLSHMIGRRQIVGGSL